MTLVDFSVASPGGSVRDYGINSDMIGCRVYATVREQGVAKSETICGGEKRFKHIYTSRTNMIEIRVVGQDTSSSQQQFLLQYEGNDNILFAIVLFWWHHILIWWDTFTKLLLSNIMVKVMYNDKLIYKVVIWVFFGVILWKEKELLRKTGCHITDKTKVACNGVNNP